jgi:hypothetical protein
MQIEPIIGIDPVDFKSRDTLTINWDKQSESWVVDGEQSHCHLYGGPVGPLPLGNRISWDSPQDISSHDPLSRYNTNLDLEFNKSEFVAYMYILGFSDEEIICLTIDEIVEKIRNVYKYKHGIPSDTASQTFIKRKNIALLRGVRRAHHKIQVIENGN